MVEMDGAGRLKPHYADPDLPNAKWRRPRCPGSTGIGANLSQAQRDAILRGVNTTPRRTR